MAEETGIEFHSAGAVTVAVIKLGELTSACTDALLSWAERAGQADSPPRLVVDLANVKFIDSVALGGLVLLLRRIKQSDGRFGLVGVSGHCLRLLEVTGLRKVFDLYEDLATAMGALKQGA